MMILTKYEKQLNDIIMKYDMELPDDQIRSNIGRDISALIGFPVEDITTYDDIDARFLTYAVILPNDSHILKVNF